MMVKVAIAPPASGQPGHASNSSGYRFSAAVKPPAMQVRTMAFEPFARTIMGIAAQLGDQRVKGRTMIEMGQMRDFMRDNRQPDMIGCHDQPPAIADTAG